MAIDPGITGGIKLGYFLDSCPYLGVEAEGSIGNQSPALSDRVLESAASGGVATGRWTGQSLLVWTMALHLVGRYGFLPDQEVPFGRLQPYVGIGPGLVMLYGEADSAKNFGLEVEAGLRYMFTKHLGGFVEYKFSKQWAVELESHHLLPARRRRGPGHRRHHVILTCHKVVTGDGLPLVGKRPFRQDDQAAPGPPFL